MKYLIKFLDPYAGGDWVTTITYWVNLSTHTIIILCYEDHPLSVPHSIKVVSMHYIALCREGKTKWTITPFAFWGKQYKKNWIFIMISIKLKYD